MNRLLLDVYVKQASGPIDGIFVSLTKRGVERSQIRLNQLLPDMPLVIDGIVGPLTRSLINNSCGNSSNAVNLSIEEQIAQIAKKIKELQA
jgi:hypothetical protein